MVLFDMDIEKLKGVGPKGILLFHKLGVYNVKDLLSLYPKTYENWNCVNKAEKLYTSGLCGCLKLKIVSRYKTVFLNNGSISYKVEGSDGENIVNIVFFNDKYTVRKLVLDEEFLVYGNITKNLYGYQMICPKIKSFLKQNMGLQPIYPQVKGLNSGKIKLIIKNLFASGIKIDETLPNEIIKKYHLCYLEYAVRNIHFPENSFAIEEAKKRLIFEEILIWQISMSIIKKYSRQRTEIKITSDYTDEFLFLLPFTVTDAQMKSIKECTQDMLKDGNLSMNRLLQGDVGSGKTVVAAAVSYNVVRNGYQVAVMVPTELLAVQHYKTFKKIFYGMNIKIDLLSGKLKSSQKSEIKRSIESGESDIIIGTHALISEEIVFSNLGFVITDEQHRFGVKQRTKLIDKGKNPHILIMSATPIPRTLSLIIYGDLDISVIDELPPGRKEIKTFCINSSKRDRALNFLKDILIKGHQGYIVCANIEDSENNKTAVKSYCNKILKGIFDNFNIGIIHGKMPVQEREIIMCDFAEGKIQLLISTTVIEVGIDVSNASIVIIENAERFGLSQLHQLRGRVGRGTCESYCILISDSRSEDSIKRFKAMCSTNNGFKLANEDLALRGPGEIFGNKQHGLSGMVLTKDLNDMELLVNSKKAAEYILKEFNNSENSILNPLKIEVDSLVNYVRNKVVI